VKLLFDENLSVRLVQALATEFPGSLHVGRVGLRQRSDREIWDYARAHGLAIVTKDDDFSRFSFVYGAPPKVILVNLGNCPTQVIADALITHRAEIEAFCAVGPEALLIIGAGSLGAAR
jgi:predicted nuclease of predicted toxin-antitoxin system